MVLHMQWLHVHCNEMREGTNWEYGCLCEVDDVEIVMTYMYTN